MVFSRRVMLRSVKRLYSWVRNDPVDENLRGWSWDKPPVKPRAYLGLGVSEVAYRYCPSYRDIWLRRKLGVKSVENDLMFRGRLLHEALNLSYRYALRYMVSGMPGWLIYEKIGGRWREIVNKYRLNNEYAGFVERVFKSSLLTILGEYEYEASVNGEYGAPILYSEYHVDGTPLGLSSSLSIDAIAEKIIVDFKYGYPRDFHRLGLAGYALALESEYEVPYDYGILIYIIEKNNVFKISYTPVYISNNLRRLFLEERDNIIDMLLEDREPQPDTKCLENCPYRRYCMGG